MNGELFEGTVRGRRFRVVQLPMRGVSEEVAVDIPLLRPLLLGASVRLGDAPDPLGLSSSERQTTIRGIEPERVDVLVHQTKAGRSLVRRAQASNARVTFDDQAVHLSCAVLGDGKQAAQRLADHGARLAKLVERAREQLPAAPWESALRHELTLVAKEYGAAVSIDDFSIQGTVLGAPFEVRLAAGQRYSLAGRIRLSRPLGEGVSIRTREAAIGFFEQLFGGGLTGNGDFDRAYCVEPATETTKRLLSPELQAELVAVREAGPIRVSRGWAELQSPVLHVGSAVGALIKIEAALRPRSNESPYR